MGAGDHIYVERAWGLYSHHGIDCGDGSVIHFQGPDPMRARVKRSSLEEFRGEGGVKVLRESEEPARGSIQGFVTEWLDRRSDRLQTPDLTSSPDAVVARAESRLGEGEYDLVFNNCEHFANWCRTGRSYSDQSDRMLAPVLDTSVFAALSPQALLRFATEG